MCWNTYINYGDLMCECFINCIYNVKRCYFYIKDCKFVFLTDPAMETVWTNKPWWPLGTDDRPQTSSSSLVLRVLGVTVQILTSPHRPLHWGAEEKSRSPWWFRQELWNRTGTTSRSLLFLLILQNWKISNNILFPSGTTSLKIVWERHWKYSYNLAEKK